MELHRLEEMKTGYDETLFNKLYKETKGLRRSLASQIDHRRYGVSPDIILSWFDDKFIFVFNKHADNKDPDVLKGFIINSLKTFKLRILRVAYQKEGEFYNSIVSNDIEDFDILDTIPDHDPEEIHSIFYDTMMEFMKSHLTDNAYLVLQLKLNPPPYIISRLERNTSRIPNELIIEFLNIEYDDYADADNYIKILNKEINQAIKNAKEYFRRS